MSSSKDVHNVGKDIKAAELISKTLEVDLETYLSDCVLYGVNADLGDDFVAMTEPLRQSFIDRVTVIIA